MSMSAQAARVAVRRAVCSGHAGRLPSMVTSRHATRSMSHLAASSQSLARPAMKTQAHNASSLQSRTFIFGRRKPRPIRNAVVWTLLLFGATFGVAYHLDSRSAIHRWIAMPILHTVLDPETAQKLAVKLLSLGVMPNDLGIDDVTLQTEIAGLSLKNPIGLAAGFDKQGEAIDGLLDLGFGIVEIGSVTPQPQPGNELPRYFRLSADHGAINRFGFNSDGHIVVLGRLRERIQKWLLRASKLAQARIPLPAEGSEEHNLLENADIEKVLASQHVPRSLRPGQLLAVNLGKNKNSPENSVEDYVKGVHKLGPYADLLVINVSSPNTPGLRSLQRKTLLSDLMSQVTTARDRLPRHGAAKTPIFVKIAPDLDREELNDIADAALRAGIEGLIVSNTTVQRPSSLLSPPELTNEKGGLSGAPLKPLAIRALQTVRNRVGDRMSIIGCGGIFSGQDALDFARAGADAVELYTSFGYEGVGHPRRIKDELMELLHKQGTTWKASVGKGLVSPADTKLKLPENERERTRAGGLQDRINESVASVKGELEEWRGLLGMSNAKASSLARADQQRAEKADQMDRPARTAKPIFRPDPQDKEYINLLDKVNGALGLSTTEQDAAAVHEPSETDKLRARLGMALQDPGVAPSAANTGTIKDGTTASGATPTRGVIQSGANEPPQLYRVDARSNVTGADTTTGGGTNNTYRLQMGGKPEFNAADRRRVV